MIASDGFWDLRAFGPVGLGVHRLMSLLPCDRFFLLAPQHSWMSLRSDTPSHHATKRRGARVNERLGGKLRLKGLLCLVACEHRFEDGSLRLIVCSRLHRTSKQILHSHCADQRRRSWNSRERTLRRSITPNEGAQEIHGDRRGISLERR